MQGKAIKIKSNKAFQCGINCLPGSKGATASIWLEGCEMPRVLC